MKVLVFNGSPKKEKSDTMHMTRAFLAGLNSIQKNDVSVIDVIDRHIEYCRGCLACMQNGGNCDLNDDMKSILSEILKADVIVWSFPLYCYGMPSHLKALVDRILPLSVMEMHEVNGKYEHMSVHDFSKQKYVMISGCGFPSRTQNFEAMEQQFYCLFGKEQSSIIAVTESPMFNAVEADAVTKPFLKIVEQAGKEFSEYGIISKTTMAKIKTPMIPVEMYEKICNGA